MIPLIVLSTAVFLFLLLWLSIRFDGPLPPAKPVDPDPLPKLASDAISWAASGGCWRRR